MIRSLQRVRERQARTTNTVNPSPQPQMPAPDNVSIVHTITPDGDRRTRLNPDSSNLKPQWNSSTVYQSTKVPRSVFVDGNRPIEPVVQRQVITSGSPNRSVYTPEVTPTVKVVRAPPTAIIEEPYRTAPVYVQQSYQPNTRLIRTDPEGLISIVLKDTKSLIFI